MSGEGEEAVGDDLGESRLARSRDSGYSYDCMRVRIAFADVCEGLRVLEVAE